MKYYIPFEASRVTEEMVRRSFPDARILTHKDLIIAEMSKAPSGYLSNPFENFDEFVAAYTFESNTTDSSKTVH